MRRHVRIIATLLCIAAGAAGTAAIAKTSIVDTKHNLSLSGPGQIKALTEDRVCIFCHTPHNANPLTPLWNKNIEGINYTLYAPYLSSTLLSPPPGGGPTGASRLCLSCHDGTIALGEVLQPSQRITMNVPGGIPASSPSYFGTSLERHHPVSFSYFQALPNPELAPAPPGELPFYGNGVMQCTTCHDAHDNSYKKFLRVNNARSGLCITCHIMNGWDATPHSTSPAAWNLMPPNPWPRTGMNTDFAWLSVQQNGCENCHAPHSAGGPRRLLNAREEENNCYPCHNGNVAARNVQSQFLKLSRHQVDATTIGVTANHHEANESPVQVTSHVECADCHNPHAATGWSAGAAPVLPGSLQKVSGVDVNGAALTYPASASYEYEICFKCHANPTAQSIYPPIPRPAKDVNTRLAFQSTNESFHPVTAIGKNPDVPSIPSAYVPSMTTTTMIYCTDCHDSDESRSIGGTGPRGPHGSLYYPLLRERYETADNTPESASAYALCYRCHNRTSILADISFRKNLAGRGGHSGHCTPGGAGGSAVNAPCSICHDPHGVRDDNLVSGSHTHLINFDLRYVSALPGSGNTYPVFTDNGSRAGSCTLVCHGREHRAATNSYP